MLAHYKSNAEIVGAGLCARPQDALNLTQVGREVEKTIQYIAQNYENVKIENAAVMPNHIHLLILLDDFASRRTGVETRPYKPL